MKSLYLISFLSILLFSCSPVILKPIPAEDRQSVYIYPLENLTNENTNAFVPYEKLCNTVINGELIDVIEKNFEGKIKIRTYPNPFRAITSADSSNAQFKIRGVCERLSYEPAEDVDDVIAKYAVFGILGIGYTKISYNDMCLYSQYRIWILDNSSTVIDSFVTVGIAAGNREKISRKQLTNESNSNAAYRFGSKFTESIFKKHRYDLPSKLDYPEEKFENSKNIYLYMKN